MKLKTRAVLLLDTITQPITQWLAFESTLKEIQSLIPPKDSKTLTKMMRMNANCLPQHERGAYLYLIHNALENNADPDDCIMGIFSNMKRKGGGLCQ